MKKVNKRVAKDFGKLSLEAHKKLGGKIELKSKINLKTSNDLSVAYTPGVAAVSTQIFKDKNQSTNIYTLKKNTVAIISDGSAVLGLGNIGPYAAIPVMEGKAAILKAFANVDAFPITINSTDTEEIIRTIKNIEPVFGGVNLEDIAAPACFIIENRLRKELNIPVMHDDQWGAATVTLAALINSLKLVKKKNVNVSVCLVGAGAAGITTAKMIGEFKVMNLTVFDTKGAINLNREDLKIQNQKNSEKREIAKMNTLNLSGDLKSNMKNFDVFIGLSKPNILTSEMVSEMKKDSIIFALANPFPEIMPDEAKKGGAKIMGTGRSDFPNQINNSLFFPGFWRGMLDRQTSKNKNSHEYNLKMLVKCAEAIAVTVKPNFNKILPSTLDKKVHSQVAKTVRNFKK